MLAGFLLVNKPVGISSYACISHIKRVLRSSFAKASDFAKATSDTTVDTQKIRIGHAGTLDPFASGLLIIAIGREATRLLPRCMEMKKTYVATGKCGELTDTLDCTGTVVATSGIIPSEQDLRVALNSFGSSYEQIPPIYSALKHQGVPMYALARKNMLDEQQLQAVADAKRRTIQLYEKQFLSYHAPYFTIQITVSQGTYIRTLVNDIALRAGSCATTYELARTAIGQFTLADAVDLASIQDFDALNKSLIDLHSFFQ
jgi:tRNA pseudouridine55 synthase